jgi:hypothetical protein
MFSYVSEQTHFTQQKGKQTAVTEHVEVQNGKGTITVTKMHNGQKVSKSHPLTRKQIKNIQMKKFMPGLFRPCLDHCDKTLGLLPMKMTPKIHSTPKVAAPERRLPKVGMHTHALRKTRHTRKIRTK